MTDDWIPHDGSPNPAPGWLVEVEFRAGSRSSKPKPSDVWVWHHKDSGADILLYRKYRLMTRWEQRHGRADPALGPDGRTRRSTPLPAAPTTPASLDGDAT